MRALSLLAILLVAVVIASSCSDDTTGPGTGTLSLDRMWPNADGTLWSYEWMRTVLPFVLPQTYPTEEEVPAIPSMEEAYELLVNGTGSSASSQRNFFELSFDGSDTTRSGVEGQNLQAMVYLSEHILRAHKLEGDASFLAQLARFRPDLRAKIESIPGVDLAAPVLIFPTPTLLHGGIFEKTSDYIGSYGDVDQDLAWQYLGADLAVGSQFDFQLVPSLASDAWLHVLVRRQFTYRNDGQSFAKSLECLYVVDFGVNESSPGSGEYSRSFTVGTIVFAPDVGPVYSQERLGIDTSLQNPDGFGYNELNLLPASLPEPDPGVGEATLENIWPNTDGSFWEYLAWAEEGFTDYSHPPEAPLPSMEDLYALLHGSSLIDSTTAGHRNFMELAFHGVTTTESGAEGQDLRETVYLSASSGAERIQVDPDLEFLHTLLRARPELSTRARELYPGLMTTIDHEKRARRHAALLLHGGVWEKTEAHIGTYGDVDQSLAWKYLDADLEPGDGFTFQLVPALADDVWLHARVWRELDLTVGDQRYPDCIEVFYVVDLGVQVLTDEGGEIVDTFRSFTFGTLSYAPSIGPIHSQERGYFGGPEDQSIVVESMLELVGAGIAQQEVR